MPVDGFSGLFPVSLCSELWSLIKEGKAYPLSSGGLLSSPRLGLVINTLPLPSFWITFVLLNKNELIPCAIVCDEHAISGVTEMLCRIWSHGACSAFLIAKLGADGSALPALSLSFSVVLSVWNYIEMGSCRMSSSKYSVSSTALASVVAWTHAFSSSQ